MSRTKDILIVGLALSSGALAVVVWRQQNELARRMPGAGTSVLVPASTMTIRTAAHRTLANAPRGDTSGALDRENPERPSATSESGFSFAPERPVKPARGRTSALVKLMENPEFLEALTRQRHAMLDARFGDLFRQLNLESEQLAAFKRLLVEKENIALDVVTVSESSPDGPLSPEALRSSIRVAQGQIEQAIHSSLGGDRYTMYRDYERTLAQRATVTQLEQRLSYTRDPLSPAQAEAVVRIMASTTPPPAENTTPPVSVLVRPGAPDAVPLLPATAATGRVTEEAIAQAQTVLTPPQVEALKEIQLEQQAAQKTAQMIRDVAPTVVEILPTLPTLLLH